VFNTKIENYAKIKVFIVIKSFIDNLEFIGISGVDLEQNQNTKIQKKLMIESLRGSTLR